MLCLCSEDSTAKDFLCLSIYTLLLWLPYSPPLNLLASCSMNRLAFVLVQLAAVEGRNNPNQAKLNWVEVIEEQLLGMAHIRLLWMSVNLLWSLTCVAELCKCLSSFSFSLPGITSYASSKLTSSSRFSCSSASLHHIFSLLIVQVSLLWNCL